jgi:hypothetical protein
LNDYDVLGFDADHCLVKYNTQALTELIVNSFLSDLTNRFGYPKVKFDFENGIESLMLNSVVWDIQNGTLLTLVEGKKITSAVCG